MTKVLIAVAIDEQGRYNASGWSGSETTKADIAESALDSYGGCYEKAAAALHFVEAWVPTPVATQSVTVQGEVVKPC